MTRHVVPSLRRFVQTASVLLLLGLPILSLYSHYKAAHAIADLNEQEWRTTAIRGIDRFVGESERRREWVDETQGTFWSMRLFSYSLSDPLAGAEAIVGSRRFYTPMLWSLLVPVVVTLLLGRVFCGWICPINTLLEIVDKCRGLLGLLEIRERNLKFSPANKYILLVVGLGFVALTSVPFLALVYPPAVMSREMHLFVFGAGLGTGLYLIGAICAFELLVSKRWWCRYICPGGALYSLLSRFRLIRVRRDIAKCTECGECVRLCQFDLKPMLIETTGMECTNCATCIAGCDDDALQYRLVLPIVFSNRNGTPRSKAELEKQDRTHESVVSGMMKMLLGAAALSLLATTPAEAHHILGLPHYSYKENYPQTPTLEYPATTGPYDVLLTSYPGSPVPGEAAIICFYIKNRETDEPYPYPVTVRVLQTYTFGSRREIYPTETHQPFDNQHKFSVTFPEDGEYVIELTMDVEGQPEVIGFLMISGDPTATMSIVIALGAGLLMFLVVVRAVKKKQDRHRRLQTKNKQNTPETALA